MYEMARKGNRMRKLFLSSTGMLLLMSLLMSSVYAEKSSNKSEFKQAYTSYQTLSEQSKWDKSLPHAKKSYELGQNLYADQPETVATLADNYALNLMKLKQFDEAVPALLEVLSLYEKIHGPDSFELIVALTDISRSLVELESGTKFKKYLDRAIIISKTHNGGNSAEHGQMLVDSAIIFSKANKKIAAKKNLKDGHNILLNTLGEKHARTGIAAYNLGRLEFFEKRFSKSVDYFEIALKSFEYPDKPSNPYELTTHGILVKAYEKLNQSDKATKHCLAIGRMTPRGDIQDYLPLVKFAPAYPGSAAKSGIQGEVTVKYDVDASGFVVSPVIVENTTSSTALEKASIDAALKFRYAPGFVDGEPVVTKGVMNRFKYVLSN